MARLRLLAIMMSLGLAAPVIAGVVGASADGGVHVTPGPVAITAEGDLAVVVLAEVEKAATSSQWIKSKHLPYWLFGIGAITFGAIGFARKRGYLPTGRAVVIVTLGASAAVAAGTLIFAGVQPWKGIQLAFGPWLGFVFQEVGKATGLVRLHVPARARGARSAANAAPNG